MSASYPAQRSFEDTTENALPSLLHPFARHHARLRERAHRVTKQRLAWRVQDVLAGCGLIQVDYSIACGRVVHIPEVASVVIGPTSRLKIRLLPGQMPEDFTAKAPTIEYHLGVPVRIAQLEPPFLELHLLPPLQHTDEDASTGGLRV
ncbi:MAG: hypothetical protein M3186_16905 [Actinomycetota bacterium]|nr:hypothetical protein [Actinomycetota bacterium]